MNSIHTGKNGGFASVIGQQEAVSMILQTMHAGRLPHAIMVCGPSGCGKLPFAMALARYVCCTNPSDNDSCGECTSCRMADKLEHPDIHFVFPVIRKKDGSSVISDDWLPEWRQRLKRSPYFSLANCAEIWATLTNNRLYTPLKAMKYSESSR